MDFSGLPQWVQDAIPWVTVGTLFIVFALSAWALGVKVWKWLSHKRSALD